MNFEELKLLIENSQKFEYHFFYGGPFSQWFTSEFELNGMQYDCVEQYIMAKKAELFGDFDALNRILNSKHPDEQKKIGRLIKNFDDDIWSEHKLTIVTLGNLAKFNQNLQLKEKLFATENKILVEANPYDRVWGIGLGINHPDHKDPIKWRGKNLLGFVLMLVRDQLKFESETL